jgi:tRNA threonylcarbamoyl adenosine modification protein YeaZ
MMKQDLVLSIEAAVGGGSLSILTNQIEIDGWTGSTEISRAEDILEQISNLLTRNKLKKESIEVIAVSIGAGSLTGEKIGRAIAQGLAKSLNCRLVKTSVLESLLREFDNKSAGEFITAIPIGKNCVQWQTFTIKDNINYKSNTRIQTSDIDEFIEQINKLDCRNVMLSANFRTFYERSFFKKIDPINISSNSLAKLIGLSNASDNVLE